MFLWVKTDGFCCLHVKNDETLLSMMGKNLHIMSEVLYHISEKYASIFLLDLRWCEGVISCVTGASN